MSNQTLIDELPDDNMIVEKYSKYLDGLYNLVSYSTPELTSFPKFKEKSKLLFFDKVE